MAEWGHIALGWGLWGVCWGLCALGMLLSCVTLSGMWLVLAAAGVAWHLAEPGGFPGAWTLAGMAAVCTVSEVWTTVAASWGVAKRGGGKASVWWAFWGSLAGAVVGGMVVPVPLVGSLVGMAVGSFVPVYAAERRRLQGNAGYVARGAVWATLAAWGVKVGTTAALIAWLAVGLWR